MDESQFGKALRERIDTIATAVAKASVNARFEAFGKDVTGWAERAARDAVLAASLEAVRPVSILLGRLEGQVQRLEADLIKAQEALQAVDAERLGNDYAEVGAAQGRLEKARGDILAEIRAASAAVAEQMVASRALVSDLIAARDDARSVATSLAVRIEAIHEEVAKVAGAAAGDAAEALKGDMLATMDDFAAGLRSMLTAEVTKFRAESEGVLARTRADAAARLDALAKRATGSGGLLLAAFRGPYVAGESYAQGDVTTFQGSTWIAKRRPGGERPSPKPDGAWALFASGGVLKPGKVT